MIRKALITELDQIEEIYNRVHDGEEAGKTTIGWVRGVYPTRATAEAAIGRGDLFVNALEDDRIVAVAVINQTQVAEYADCAWEYEVPAQEVMVLHTLAVHPECGGHGYGKEFVRFYEQYALAHGCRYLRMDTGVTNAAARRLYAGLGYKEPGIVCGNFNGIPGMRLVCLEKKL